MQSGHGLQALQRVGPMRCKTWEEGLRGVKGRKVGEACKA